MSVESISAMPYVIDLTLHVHHVLPSSAGEPHRALNALLYHWLDAAEPALSKFVHEQAEPKPFTVSPLWQEGEGNYRFRMTLLEDQYAAFIARGMEKERTVRVGKEVLEIRDSRLEHCGYEELAQAVKLDGDLILQFTSPMSFRVNDLDDPLPLARRVFQSHLTKWNAFSGFALEPAATFLEWVESCVVISRMDLQTDVLRFERHVQIGCVGRVQYRVAKRAGGDEPVVRGLNILGNYAAFCGTGRKTTQGMGMTRRIKVWDEG